ncbi:hypothetical protein [Streptomyces sp. NPDC093544]|uniref:hypothetical protein n=1 Tax=Streptomyces sp. NPDC093544 TaxID=3155200 RepID=UPI003416FBD6
MSCLHQSYRVSRGVLVLPRPYAHEKFRKLKLFVLLVESDDRQVVAQLLGGEGERGSTDDPAERSAPA